MKRLFTRILLPLALLLASSGAFAAALTDFAENKLVDALLRGQAIGTPASFYIGLDTSACTEVGGGIEVTGGSYARVAVTSSLANWAGTQAAASTTASSGTGGTSSNNAVITFPTPSAGWGTVLSVRFWDAASAGAAWICIALTSSQTINTGNTVTFPAASLSLQIDN